jgi:hypothetical protein
MTRCIAGLLLFVAATTGCRICSDCTDYSPPVADGPYAGMPGRAGSAFNGVVMTPAVGPTDEVPTQTPPAPPTSAAPSITQPPGVVPAP